MWRPSRRRAIVLIDNVRKNQAMHRVVVLALDWAMPFELAIPNRIFGSVFDATGKPLYEVVTCSLDGGPVRTNADFVIAVEHGPEVLETADTVVIPPVGIMQARPELPKVPDGLGAALDKIAPGTRLVSLCGAAFLLAAMGRLDGRPATTHWILAEQFAAQYPTIDLDPDVLFVDDGDVLTAAGAAAGIDLCLHLVRRDHGSEVANQVARFCVVPPYRDGGQRQFIQRPTPDVAAVTTEPARAWALERLEQRLVLADLAARVNMGLRTFTRRFREEVGMSPHRWLTQQRIELARRLLETTDLPVERIASGSGLGTGAGMRQHFQQAVGVAPSAYRRTFRRDNRTGPG
jgi:transcriptional regulator GlxA family with amidase domain